MALLVRIRAWQDRRRVRRHERRNEKLIALSDEPRRKDRNLDPEGHGKRHGADIDKALWDHSDDVKVKESLPGEDEWVQGIEDDFDGPKY